MILYITHSGLVTIYWVADLYQHWFEQWLVVWRYQTIARTNVDLPSMRSDTWVMFTWVLKISILKFCLKFAHWKSQLTLHLTGHIMGWLTLALLGHFAVSLLVFCNRFYLIVNRRIFCFDKATHTSHDRPTSFSWGLQSHFLFSWDISLQGKYKRYT